MMKSPATLATPEDHEAQEVIRTLKPLRKLREVLSEDTPTMKTHPIQTPTTNRHHPHHLLNDMLGLPLLCLVGPLLLLLHPEHVPHL